MKKLLIGLFCIGSALGFDSKHNNKSDRRLVLTRADILAKQQIQKTVEQLQPVLPDELLAKIMLSKINSFDSSDKNEQHKFRILLMDYLIESSYADFTFPAICKNKKIFNSTQHFKHFALSYQKALQQQLVSNSVGLCQFSKTSEKNEIKLKKCNELIAFLDKKFDYITSSQDRFNEFCKTTNIKELDNMYAEESIENFIDLHIGLYTACEMGNQKMCAYLLDHGANPNIPHANGKTPLMIAASKGHLECVKLLLGAHADKNIRYDKSKLKKNSKLTFAKLTKSFLIISSAVAVANLILLPLVLLSPDPAKSLLSVNFVLVVITGYDLIEKRGSVSLKSPYKTALDFAKKHKIIQLLS